MKNRYVLLLDIPLIALATFGAFAVRFDLSFFTDRPEFLPYMIAATVLKPTVFAAMGMYRRYWRYASVQELLVVFGAVSTTSVVMAILVSIASYRNTFPDGLSRTVVFTDWILTLATTGGLRLAIRLTHEAGQRASRTRSGGTRRVLIVGAGIAGMAVVKEMRRNPQLGMVPAGFVDDDPEKVDKLIADLRVWGDTQSLPETVRSHRIDCVVIAMPAAEGQAVRRILNLCTDVGVPSQIMPGVFELLDGRVTINRLRNVDITDLLRRAPADWDGQSAAFVRGRVVLITGGGGSIGLELARQVAGATPARLVLLGHGENSIFEAEAKLRAQFPSISITSVIADIRDDARLGRVFDSIKPAIVFHAAAHKHVPLMEDNPEEAVTNNILGTRNVVRQAIRTDVERFVLISTDKAVSPSSVMGASKRVAEAIVRRAGAQYGRAFVAVRFGNVLGSRGSVVNTFKEQIALGGPVTVTHPAMTRFFMTIPEAVHLVLQSSGHGVGGELYVLDMGQPVKIVDLARDLIKLSGFLETEIPIVFSGIRPGEKMEETLFDDGLDVRPTSHASVFEVIGPDPCRVDELDDVITQLERSVDVGDRPAILKLLAHFIPGLHLPGSPRRPPALEIVPRSKRTS